MEKLREQFFEMESTLGGIGLNIETLTDVEYILGQLVDKMGDFVEKENQWINMNEYHRKVRALSELIRYSMKELNDNYKKSQDIQRDMLKVIREEINIKKPTHV